MARKGVGVISAENDFGIIDGPEGGILFHDVAADVAEFSVFAVNLKGSFQLGVAETVDGFHNVGDFVADGDSGHRGTEGGRQA